MPKVEKGELVRNPKGVKDPMWGSEPFWMWGTKVLVQIILFFVILITIIEVRVTRANMILYFIAIFITYVITGMLAFFIGYCIVKYVFGLLRYKVKPFLHKLKGKRKYQKVWIYLFTCAFQAIFFVMAVYVYVAMEFDIPEFWALVIAWAILAIVAKLLGKFLYFLLYTW